MKKQEAIDFMGWENLPEAQAESKLKCVVLVKRTTGVLDYAIASKGNVVADIGFKAGIVSIVEYYPNIPVDVPAEKKVEKKVKKVKEKKEKPAPPIEKKQGVTVRDEMIEFLVSHKNKRSVIEVMTNDELLKLAKI